MNIAAIFIRRPVMTTLVMAGDSAVRDHGLPAAAGERSAERRLPDDPGQRRRCRARVPETMAASVATPLEKQFSTIAGLDSMTSASLRSARRTITLQFDLSRNIDAAAQDVQAAIAAAARQLPPNMPTPPSYSKVNPADTPVIYLAITSDTMPLYRARRIRRDDHGAAHLHRRRRGAGAGLRRAEVRRAHPARSAASSPRAASASTKCATAVRNSNVNLPTGVLNGPYTAYTVQANGQLYNADDYKRITVA